MASRSEHCADCRRELGEPFDHVHEWLDALFKVLHQKHRSVRHHAGGVEQVRKMWGDRAARAAEIHIMRDCGGVVPSEKEAQMMGPAWKPLRCEPRGIMNARPPAKSPH
jgi:hypothetical protein